MSTGDIAGAEAAVTAMSAQPDSVQAQRTGCSALMVLHKQAVVDAGGLAAVVAAMVWHPADAELQRYGCGTLDNVSYYDAAHDQATADGVRVRLGLGLGATECALGPLPSLVARRTTRRS